MVGLQIEGIQNDFAIFQLDVWRDVVLHQRVPMAPLPRVRVHLFQGYQDEKVKKGNLTLYSKMVEPFSRSGSLRLVLSLMKVYKKKRTVVTSIFPFFYHPNLKLCSACILQERPKSPRNAENEGLDKKSRQGFFLEQSF